MAERRTRQAGFTLIEIMVVMVIIGLLMALVGPNLIEPGAHIARRLGIPPLAGPLVFSLAGFTAAGLLIFVNELAGRHLVGHNPT